MYLLYKLSVTGTGINTSGLNIPLSVKVRHESFVFVPVQVLYVL